MNCNCGISLRRARQSRGLRNENRSLPLSTFKALMVLLLTLASLALLSSMKSVLMSTEGVFSISNVSAILFKLFASDYLKWKITFKWETFNSFSSFSHHTSCIRTARTNKRSCGGEKGYAMQLNIFSFISDIRCNIQWFGV